ncbi:hypothetical protein Pan153_34010 [Gimesia panareensis]|uniref:Uncharacterized protein n=1 Tax=Gimesia panareensis TaxID=2527978 RepID=A0A518FR40_9PLAN|nr:hypothetical protein Pan153_34010 [Gimesia panareensis]
MQIHDNTKEGGRETRMLAASRMYRIMSCSLSFQHCILFLQTGTNLRHGIHFPFFSSLLFPFA